MRYRAMARSGSALKRRTRIRGLQMVTVMWEDTLKKRKSPKGGIKGLRGAFLGDGVA